MLVILFNPLSLYVNKNKLNNIMINTENQHYVGNGAKNITNNQPRK